jgi:hypothetical protein
MFWKGLPDLKWFGHSAVFGLFEFWREYVVYFKASFEKSEPNFHKILTLNLVIVSFLIENLAYIWTLQPCNFILQPLLRLLSLSNCMCEWTWEWWAYTLDNRGSIIKFREFLFVFSIFDLGAIQKIRVKFLYHFRPLPPPVCYSVLFFNTPPW